MDLTSLVVAILGLNLAVFLCGCLLAAYRTWDSAARDRRSPRGNGRTHPP
jgi:hypothetical protein